MRANRSSFLRMISRACARFLPGPLSPPLRAAQAELRRSLHLAFDLATTHGRAIVLEPWRGATKGRISLHLPEGVRWGRPAAIPLPPCLAGTGWRGGRPLPITVMPQGRASANVWFLHHGRQALCLRLDLSGSVELLRYRPVFGTWIRC